MNSCTIIGISDSRQQWFPPEVHALIQSGTIFSGGKRHHDIMAPLLPQGHQWINITVPLEDVFKQYEAYDHIIIFASGDPLFFGFANTVQRICPQVKMHVIPTFNSLQTLAHRMCIPYHDMHVVSLTGRTWEKFDEALINGEKLIGVLTDHTKTPEAIHARMQTYGYTNYTMTVGENLGNEERERISTYHTPPTTTDTGNTSGNVGTSNTYSHPNCIILQQTFPLIRPFGIPDSAFTLLDGRTRMITKMPIRLLTLQALNLPRRHTLWDIGACTGSISIEARLRFPHLHIEAFEIRPECETIIRENARRFHAPGINLHIGEFLSFPCNPIVPPAPDAVFIGGHGGQLKHIMAKVLDVLTEDGCIVMNSVTPHSHQLWDEACKELNLQQAPPVRIQLNDFNPIEILICKR